MTSTQSIDLTGPADQRPALRLENLIPIAVVIAAGCESCADSMVRRAMANGATQRQVEYTLGIVAHLRSSECFLKAVGADLAERMDKPIAAARSAARVIGQRSKACGCCASAAEERSAQSELV